MSGRYTSRSTILDFCSDFYFYSFDDDPAGIAFGGFPLPRRPWSEGLFGPGVKT